MSTLGYQMEKSGNIIRKTCWMLEHTTKIESVLDEEDGFDMREGFRALLWDATKLYASSARQLSGNSSAGTSWSPELPRYLYDNPEKCKETLEIVAGEDYDETYYK
ncbi:hypothetical protein [Roseibacillus persicicus]|uniref:Uncharacterized protein n=1 Tax=Roseibacillus persicicus TaxID=454148 RepID=A0A918TY02_9BACT|nr:hypothetical protein [Roseibacillus persicicus]GHC68200.1 hypothetical protein GCM10007100_40310 [Roseibacillus persicicus]